MQGTKNHANKALWTTTSSCDCFCYGRKNSLNRKKRNGFHPYFKTSPCIYEPWPSVTSIRVRSDLKVWKVCKKWRHHLHHTERDLVRPDNAKALNYTNKSGHHAFEKANWCPDRLLRKCVNNKTKPRQSQERPLGFAVLPYVKGASDRLGCVLQKFHIWLTYRPLRT